MGPRLEKMLSPTDNRLSWVFVRRRKCGRSGQESSTRTRFAPQTSGQPCCYKSSRIRAKEVLLERREKILAWAATSTNVTLLSLADLYRNRLDLGTNSSPCASINSTESHNIVNQPCHSHATAATCAIRPPAPCVLYLWRSSGARKLGRIGIHCTRMSPCAAEMLCPSHNTTLEIMVR